MSKPSQPMQRAAIYCRLSRNPDGTLDATDRQLVICRKLAAERGYTVTGEYADDDLSAWKRGVWRQGWEDMFTAIDDGRHDGIISYHSDRLARNDYDGGRLLQAGEDGLGLATASGDIDLSTGDGRMTYRILLAASIKSSDDTSRRVKTKHESNRAAGHLQGRSAYGFMTNPADPKGPRIVNPDHAKVIRYVAERVLAGATWEAILDKLAADGVRTPDHGTVVGRPFTRTTLRALMMSQRIAGWIVHNGERAGRIAGGEPILDQATWDKVYSELASRKHGGPRSPNSYLSGLVVCTRCERPMSATYSKDKAGRTWQVFKSRYGKHDSTALPLPKVTNCATAIMREHVEAEVRDAVLDWQADPSRLAALTNASLGITEKRAELETELDRLRKASMRNAQKLDSGTWTDEEYDVVDQPLTARILALKAELVRYNQPDLLHDLTASRLEAGYDAATDAQKRVMIKVAIKSIRVAPAAKGLQGRDRVMITMR